MENCRLNPQPTERVLISWKKLSSLYRANKTHVFPLSASLGTPALTASPLQSTQPMSGETRRSPVYRVSRLIS